MRPTCDEAKSARPKQLRLRTLRRDSSGRERERALISIQFTEVNSLNTHLISSRRESELHKRTFMQQHHTQNLPAYEPRGLQWDADEPQIARLQTSDPSNNVYPPAKQQQRAKDPSRK